MRGDFIENFLDRNRRPSIPLLHRFRRVEDHPRKVERPRKGVTGDLMFSKPVRTPITKVEPARFRTAHRR